MRGIPVRVRSAFWLWPIGLTVAIRPVEGILRFALLAFVVTMVHEWGHASALRLTDQDPSIEIGGYGGQTFGQRRLGLRASIAASVAGPVAVLVVVGLPAWLLGQVGPVRDAPLFWPWVDDLVQLGLWWSLINLAPVLPFDGGHIAERLLGRPATLAMGVGLCGFTGLWAYDEGAAMAGRLAGAVLMLNVLACLRPDRADGGQKGEPPFGSSAQDRRGASASAHPSGRGAGLSRPDSAEELAELDRRLQEVERLEEMAWAAVRGAKFGLADRLARQAPESVSPYLLAAVAAGSGRRREALDRFEEGLFANAAPPRDSLAPLVGSGLLPFLVDRLAALSRGPGGPALATLQWSLHGGDLFDHAAEVGMARLRLVDGDERARICFEVACNLARGSVPETALVRLTDAVEGGFASGEILDLEPDLDSLRSLEGYQRVRAQLD